MAGSGTSRVALPAGVLAMADRDAGWAAWVRGLPRTFEDLLGEWDLAADGAPVHGHGALVVPVRTRDGEDAVLKVGHVHPESEQEHVALQHWHGRGAVRMLRADPRRGALLLERLQARDLTEAWDVEACEVVAGLYPLLHVPAPHRLRTLTGSVARTGEALAALPRSAPLPHRLVEQAVSLSADLVADPASTGTMVHGDLHYENVLATVDGDPRGPWLAIDPQPVSGDPHYEVAPLLWNRWDELAGGPGGVRDGVRRRFHAVVDAAGLDEDRARAWVVVRMLRNALWELEDRAAGVPAQQRDDWLTVCLAVAKAVQD